MAEQTLIAQRLIKDHLINVGGVTKVSLSKELLASASSARQTYQTYLDEEKRKKVEQRRRQKRAAVLEQLNDLKEQKKRMKSNIEALFKPAEPCRKGRVNWESYMYFYFQGKCNEAKCQGERRRAEVHRGRNK